MAKNYRALVVANALKEVGTLGGSYSGDDKYIEYYNKVADADFDVDTTPWCAIFDTYILRNAGVPTSVCPNFASCTSFRDHFAIPKNIWKKRGSYTPQGGDLIFLDWDRSGNCDHTGIVEKTIGNTVYTIEGNTKGGYTKYGVRHKSYALSYNCIAGYAALKYESISDNSSAGTTQPSNTCPYKKPSALIVYGQSGDGVRWVQWYLINKYDYDISLDGIFGADTLAAVKDFQKSMRLDVDGKVGTNTKNALETGKSTSGSNSSSNSTGSTTTNTSSYSTYIKKFQTWMNTNYKMGLTVDGICGSNTKKAMIKTLQTILKNEYKKSISIDGIFGTATKSACQEIKYPNRGNLVYLAQGMLYCRNYNANGFDGQFGTGMRTAVMTCQKAHDLDVDGIIGKNTWTVLANG